MMFMSKGPRLALRSVLRFLRSTMLACQERILRGKTDEKLIRCELKSVVENLIK